MTTENTDENPPEVPATCTLLLAPHDSLDRILVVRSLEGFATHWMNSYGAWVALPDSVEGMKELMDQLDADPTLLPMLDMEYVEVAEEESEPEYLKARGAVQGDEPAEDVIRRIRGEDQDGQIPFGD